jgi:hypothetical protein
MLRFDGTSWSRVSLPDLGSLNAIWGSGRNDVWVVGERGVLHWDGSEWTPVSEGPGNGRAVWGSGPQDVWILSAGTTGSSYHYGDELWRWDGSTWSQEQGPFPRLTSICGAGPDDVWAVGEDGVTLHRDSAGWSSISSGTTATLHSVHCTSPTDVWAVGWEDLKRRAGAIIHWDGSNWSSMLQTMSCGIAPCFEEFWDVWASGPNDVWVGGGSMLRHWDGASWELVTDGAASGYFVWGLDQQNVWLMGWGDIRRLVY